MLASHKGKAITKQAFIRCCVSGTYTPPSLRMTPHEAESYLESLKDVSNVVQVGDTIFLDPRCVVEAVHTEAGLPPLRRGIPSLREQQELLRASLQDVRNICMPSVVSAVRKEKEFWAYTAFFSGLQMTVLAYLTFLLYGWDVMEPVCFFTTSVTALCSYGYFLYYNQEHSYEGVDNHVLPTTLANELRISHIDVHKVMDDLKMLKEVDAAVSSSGEHNAVILEIAAEQEAIQ
ncbi:hypothetical protein STCU_04411 [Strigomonas culicis]|nr:hypothetical protein STCU_04411 [Strigomonas culicis]|eukprot:EPY29610.1 hypothetical protein STCU_04411 [Strigomonas culicis]